MKNKSKVTKDDITFKWRIKYLLYCIGFLALVAVATVLVCILSIITLSFFPVVIPIVVWYFYRRFKNGKNKRP